MDPTTSTQTNLYAAGNTAPTLPENGCTHISPSQTSGDMWGVFPVQAGATDTTTGNSAYYRAQYFNPASMMTSVMAGYYEFWRPKYIKASYTPVCPTSTQGTMAMAYSPQDESEFRNATTTLSAYNNTFIVMSQCPAFVEAPLYQGLTLIAYPTRHGIAMDGKGWLRTKLVETSQTAMTALLTTTCFGGVLLLNASNTSSAASTPFGHIFYEVCYEFKGARQKSINSFGYQALPPAKPEEEKRGERSHRIVADYERLIESRRRHDISPRSESKQFFTDLDDKTRRGEASASPPRGYEMVPLGLSRPPSRA